MEISTRYAPPNFPACLSQEGREGRTWHDAPDFDLVTLEGNALSWRAEGTPEGRGSRKDVLA